MRCFPAVYGLIEPFLVGIIDFYIKMGYYEKVDTCLLVLMQPHKLYPQKPDRILNIHFRFKQNADEKVKTSLREALQLLATLEIIECDPEKEPDVVIADFESSFDVLRDSQLMDRIRGNIWVLVPGGVKMPELMGAGSFRLTKMRRLVPILNNSSLLGQLTLLVSMYDQNMDDGTQIFAIPPTNTGVPVATAA